MPKVLITTVPFAEIETLPIRLLKSAGIEFVINPYNRKLTDVELSELIDDFDVLIAGTEEISELVFKNAKKLKFISRVGIGLDSVDLINARKRNIKISYTADAPAPAVADLTIGFMISLLRSVTISNNQMHKGKWHRIFGRRLSEVTVGIIGVGRIGSLVLNHLLGFMPKKVLVHDISNAKKLPPALNIEFVSKEELIKKSDIVSIHVPLTSTTNNMFTKATLLQMKQDAIIINTSRGGIINEEDLYDVMMSGHLGGAAIDVFRQEPYNGSLREIERCILTAHMGSMSVDCRTRMEIEATEEAIRFLKGEKLIGEVPEFEYFNQVEN